MGEGRQKEEDSGRLDQRAREGPQGNDQLRRDGSPPPKTGEEGPLHQLCLLSVSSTLHLHLPLRRMSAFIPDIPEKVPITHRESLVRWCVELAPTQKIVL